MRRHYPSNEGRGYVLRRIIRRACRHGKLLGIGRRFLAELCDVAIAENVAPYPELGKRAEYIKKVISIEEERFNATIDAGLAKLSDLIADARSAGRTHLSGEEVFRLYDTFGFPPDLTREIAAEAQLGVDEETFRSLMQAQRERARAARGSVGGWSDDSKKLLQTSRKPSSAAIPTPVAEARVIAIIIEDEEGARAVEEVNEGDFTSYSTNPFYGEGGGQVGDTAIFQAPHEGHCHRHQSRRRVSAYCHNISGRIRVGDTVMAHIDEDRRKTSCNHSACHLLQSALRRFWAHI